MSAQSREQPFKALGSRLKLIRQKLQESVMEVSGAVEIDAELLELFERGIERPSEDILLLMISHFGIQDDDAVSLLELAGYERGGRVDDKLSDEIPTRQPVMVMLALDTRILYSDNIHVTASKQGVVLNFTQQAGPQGQPVAIARVGMSREQAQEALRVFSQALMQIDQLPRALPAPKQPKSRKASETN